MKPVFRYLMLLLSLLCLSLPVAAEETERQAQELSGSALVTDSTGFSSLGFLFDGRLDYSGSPKEESSLTLEHEGGIGSLYLVFRENYGAYTITDNDTGEQRTFGEIGFLHEWLDIQAAFGRCPTSLTVEFKNGIVRLMEMRAFSEGQVPENVQKWQLPRDGETDLVLFATHSDDDQLFFAGLLPYYAVERGYQVQVVYLTNHYNTAPFRVHEMLNGLWAVGVRAYPVFGPFPDFGNAINKEGAFQKFKEWGWSREELNGFMVEQLRRFRPLVVVGHDLEGEYGHAQHKAYAQMVTDAVALSADPEAYPETAERYGVWDVPKTYIHLYEENPIVMDFDQPMENWEGMTPYQVTKRLGFACHVSQQKGWAWFLAGSETAAGIKKYNPCLYGLYRTTVGPDEDKTDMFENLVSHEERQRQEEEQKRREEEARREEAERLEEEARQESIAAAEADRLAKQNAEATARLRELMMGIGLWLLLAVLLVVLLVILRSRRKGGKWS